MLSMRLPIRFLILCTLLEVLLCLPLLFLFGLKPYLVITFIWGELTLGMGYLRLRMR